jgi:hypothetical protein
MVWPWREVVMMPFVLVALMAVTGISRHSTPKHADHEQ